MKLWYQSMPRPTAWAAYNEALRAVLDEAKDSGGPAHFGEFPKSEIVPWRPIVKQSGARVD